MGMGRVSACLGERSPPPPPPRDKREYSSYVEALGPDTLLGGCRHAIGRLAARRAVQVMHLTKINQ